jgi:dihydroorotate dehydrogenase
MYRRALLPVFARIDAETAHDLTLTLLAGVSRVPILLRLFRPFLEWHDPRLAVDLWGIHFRNPLGVAAGLDKNGRAFAALLQMGWGHVEVGTVTPLPQPGNPRPRVFRLSGDRALINRMGFPGEGMEAVQSNLARRSRGLGIVGVNVGANKRSVEAGSAARDYVQVFEHLYDLADYLAINVSSPNTTRLRELQGKQALTALIEEVTASRARMAVRKPLLVKLAPDLSPSEIDDIVQVCLDGHVDAVIATNTTITRPPTLQDAHRVEIGGLSGHPLRERATEIVRYLYHSTAGRLPIIGAGGIFTAEDAFEKLAAGASLVQLYTGFIYEGPGVARRINRDLVRLMSERGFASMGELTGSAVQP